MKRLIALAAVGLTVAGACGADAERRTSQSGVAVTNPVVEWDEVALRTTAAAPFDPPRESRTMAIVQGAVFDAVNSISGGYHRYLDVERAPSGASTAAAVATAAHHTLVALYPAQRQALDDAYQASMSALEDGQSRDDGVAAGERAATLMLDERAADHADDPPPAVPAGGTGHWRPEPPAMAGPLDAGWGSVTPFAITSAKELRPDAPYDLTSDAYAEDLEEVRTLGAAGSTARTSDQTSAARFWAATSTQEWNQLARQLATARELSTIETARLFAHLNFAEADGAIAAWDTKYAYTQWRPISGIRGAADDGNPATTADPAWEPLLPTPPFPDYVCGHSTLAAAAQAVMERYFGRRPSEDLTLTSPAVPGSSRSFSSFGDIVDEIVSARVWGGIHWRTSCETGRELGSEIGRSVLKRALRPS